MQITITNRRQGRSPDDIAGKESPWIPSTRGRILSLFYLAPWEPSRISFSRIEEARKRWWQGCWWSTGRSTSSSSQRFAVDDKNSGNELVAALRTTGSPAPLFPLKILLATGGEIVVLIRVEKKYGEVDGGGRRERFEKLFARCIVEMNEGYIISRDKKKNN